MAMISWNSSDKNSNIILSNEDLTALNSTSTWSGVRSILTSSTSLYLYWEVKINILSATGIFIGIGNQSHVLNNVLGVSNNGIGIYSGDGKYYFNSVWNNYSKALVVNDVIGIALDLSAKKIKFSINGTWYSDIDISSISGNLYPMVELRNGGKITANFGATAFTYSAPTNYKAYSPLLKFLIHQNGSYYTIKSANYDSITSHNFNSLTLAGGIIPNSNDINTYGFDDLNILTTSMTVGSDIFVPLTKLNDQFEIKMYKG